ncbi:MAG: imidazole glycerol phosphate synthase subunit HisH [Candidatus Scalindua sp.]
MTFITIIDYGMGNLGSIANMLKKIGVASKVSSDVSVIKSADKLILPGVGSFDNGMKNLRERDMIPILNTRVLQDKIPILGLCLGMHLFTRRSEEGQLPGLGWLDAETIRFKFDDAHNQLKVPHMGWNRVEICKPNPVFKDMHPDPRFYFAHSYHLVCKDTQMIVAQSYHGFKFASVVARDNIVGVQFHPEKSHKYGMKLLKNFAEQF